MQEPIPLSKLAQQPLEDLLLMISMKAEDIDLAERAFIAFNRRFEEPFYNYCLRSCQRLNHYYDNPALTVFNNVMYKVYMKAGSLLKIENAASEEEKYYIMLGWLERTASNDIIDLYDENKEYKETFELEDNDDKLNSMVDKWRRSQSGSYVSSPEMNLIRSALEQLSEREQHIYLALLELSEKNKYLPKEEVKRLADFYNTTNDNVYHIRLRTDRKIKEYIDKHTKPTGDGPYRFIPGRRED